MGQYNYDLKTSHVIAALSIKSPMQKNKKKKEIWELGSLKEISP